MKTMPDELERAHKEGKLELGLASDLQNLLSRLDGQEAQRRKDVKDFLHAAETIRREKEQREQEKRTVLRALRALLKKECRTLDELQAIERSASELPDRAAELTVQLQSDLGEIGVKVNMVEGVYPPDTIESVRVSARFGYLAEMLAERFADSKEIPSSRRYQVIIKIISDATQQGLFVKAAPGYRPMTYIRFENARWMPTHSDEVPEETRLCETLASYFIERRVDEDRKNRTEGVDVQNPPSSNPPEPRAQESPEAPPVQSVSSNGDSPENSPQHDQEIAPGTNENEPLVSTVAETLANPSAS